MQRRKEELAKKNNEPIKKTKSNDSQQDNDSQINQIVDIEIGNEHYNYTLAPHRSLLNVGFD